MGFLTKIRIEDTMRRYTVFEVVLFRGKIIRRNVCPPWHTAIRGGTSSAQIGLNRTALYFSIIIFCVDTWFAVFNV